MNFGDLQSLTKFILNANDGQVDVDVSATRLKELLNLRYLDEVNIAKQEGGRRWFRATQEVTWPSGQVTLSAPASVINAELLEIRDVTNDDLGVALSFSDTGNSSDLFWLDRSTLQWGETGPSSDRTLQFVFYAQPQRMVDDNDEPDLIPAQFHNLLAWSAAVELRTILDEAPPAAWVQRLDDARLALWKFLSRGRPILDSGSSAVGSGPDWDLGTVTQDGSSIGN